MGGLPAGNFAFGNFFEQAYRAIGPTKWLEPYTDKTVEALARDGTKKIAVITPGFVSDCVETLEEIDLELRETFAEAGGTHFTTVPCLNEADSAISLLEKITKREISGW